MQMAVRQLWGLGVLAWTEKPVSLIVTHLQ